LPRSGGHGLGFLVGMHSGLAATVAKNASANLVRLAGSGLVALLLPAFLVRRLPIDTYSAWALLLQWTAYVGFLDFGIQTAVARFIAHAHEVDDVQQRNGIASTALALLALAAILGVVLVGLGAWQLPKIFPAMPTDVQRQARIALLFMGGSFALGLPVSLVQAVFIGLQRNEVPMAIVLLNRGIMAGLVLVAVFQHFGLAAMGAAVAIANLVSYGASYLAWRRMSPRIAFGITRAARTYVMQISAYCGATTVWLGAMLMISGLDLTIVGIFDYSATAFYAIAATLTTFISQAQGAIFSALLPASAVLAARADQQRLGIMLVSATRYGMLILLAMALPLMIGAKWVLAAWVGNAYAPGSILILQVLIIANVVRLCALPYSTLLLGTGQQGKVILSPLAEGVTNLAASILGAYLWGAIGVAIGTLMGAFVSVGLHLFYNMPRTSLIAINRAVFVRQGLLRPLVCTLPLAIILLLRVAIPKLPPFAPPVLFIAGLTGTIFLFWQYGLLGYERQKLGRVLGSS
jgi:O-antigen/teichoic acid export membrane protein